MSALNNNEDGKSATLYFSPGSSSLAVHILLEEVGLPYRLELVSAQERKPTEPAFLKINPKGRVPVLELDGVLLTEAPAILFYLADIHPKAQLLPADSMGQFRCLEWFNWVSTTLHAIGYTQLWRPERFIYDSAQFNATAWSDVMVRVLSREAVQRALLQEDIRLPD